VQETVLQKLQGLIAIHLMLLSSTEHISSRRRKISDINILSYRRQCPSNFLNFIRPFLFARLNVSNLVSVTIITAFNCQAVTLIFAFALVYGVQKWAWTEAAKSLLGYLERTSTRPHLIIQSPSHGPCSRNNIED
jgi:hypothetical protein